MKQISVEACMLKVSKLIAKLINKTEFPDVNNFYASNSAAAHNLKTYFKEMLIVEPEILFIGEAPGIHGAYRTGIPFTSERVLQKEQPNHSILQSDYVVTGNHYEHSANIMWREIGKLPILPLLWNIMPLHPYTVNNKGIMKNRSPRNIEKEWGKSILYDIIEMFPQVAIYSVGRHAQQALDELDIDTFGHLTHPVLAHKFREDFNALFLS